MSTSVSFACPFCQAECRDPRAAGWIGKQIRCSRCGRIFLLTQVRQDPPPGSRDPVRPSPGPAASGSRADHKSGPRAATAIVAGIGGLLLVIYVVVPFLGFLLNHLAVLGLLAGGLLLAVASKATGSASLLRRIGGGVVAISLATVGFQCLVLQPKVNQAIREFQPSLQVAKVMKEYVDAMQAYNREYKQWEGSWPRSLQPGPEMTQRATQRLMAISTKGCPADFQAVWDDFLRAWGDLADYQVLKYQRGWAGTVDTIAQIIATKGQVFLTEDESLNQRILRYQQATRELELAMNKHLPD